MSYRFKNNNPNPRDSGSSSSIYTTDHHHPRTHQLDHQNSKSNISSDQQTSAVRSRWSPKPEQILILESIFNNGMVNPPKDETIRIRMVLETFGPVVDANVFYWFQNRRSKSRRLQRQIQSNMKMMMMMKANNNNTTTTTSNLNNDDPYLISSSFETHSPDYASLSATANYSCLNGGGFSSSGNFEGFHDMEDESGSVATAVTNSYMQYQHQGAGRVFGDDEGAGVVTVFINGVATEVPTGPVDMKEMMIMYCGSGGGQDLVLLHSSGHQVPINEYGFSYNSLQHGESYFLVDRST